jgi:NAD(P) transhydrogenase
LIDLDLFVIGTGPAGQRAAIQAAKLGKRVGICDRREVVGGVCVNTGTIPSKTFREALLYLTGYRQRPVYGESYTLKEDLEMEDLLFRCQHVVQQQIHVIRQQMRRNGVTILSGTASFRNPHGVEVLGHRGTTRIRSEYFVIATGSEPAAPKGVAVDGTTVITADEILNLDSLPRSMTVVGAGVIGLEYASMFGALDTEVTIIDKRQRPLEFVDSEIIDSLLYQMRNKNCVFRLGEEVESIHLRNGGAEARLKSGKRIQSEVLFYSIGRVGATAALNLGAAGLESDHRGRIPVAVTFQTQQRHIYAVGDVIGFPSLASTSMEQGRMATCHMFDVPCESIPELFPFGIYSIPEMSLVGNTEEELTRKKIPYEVGTARYREIARGVILGDDSGLLKILFHRETRKILGVHIIGTGAAELIHIGQAVLALNGTIDYFVDTVFNYPTFAECYKVAGLDGFNKVGPPTTLPFGQEP